MVNFKFLLGLFPSTEKLEEKENALIKEYLELENFKKSDDLKNFLEVKEFVASPEFKQKMESVKALDYKKTDNFAKEKEYLTLKKSSRITNYYKVIATPVYKNYLDLKDSKELEEYGKLKAIIESDAFKNKEKEIKSLKYNNSEEFRKEQEFIKLGKSAEIKNYFKILSSPAYELYKKLKDSDDLKNYLELKSQSESDKEKLVQFNSLKKDKKFIDYFKFIDSKEFKLFSQTDNSGVVDNYNKLKEFISTPEFADKKAYLLLAPAKKWEQTEEFKNAEEYKRISKDKKIVDYLKFVASKQFKLFEEVNKSGEIQHYEELEKTVCSDEFKNNKTYMLLPFKEKWKQTEEFKKDADFQKLKVSDKIKWYFNVVDSNKFDELKKWEITFSEDFADNNLDKNVWLTRFYWGDALLNDTYSMSNDQHFITDGNNLAVQNSVLKIETRREKATGKAWDPLFGFKPKEFELTSGLINTGKSFRQQYGRFRAKIKVNDNGAITNSFWLVGQKIMPQIDIFKYSKKNVAFNSFWGNITEKDGVKISSSKMSASKLNSKFFIYELEWTPTELIWKINGLVLKREVNSIPNEPMYLNISSGIYDKINGNQFPSTMEIDWIKCYKNLTSEK
jgi:beta-glucanase (GH16 family)